jgi:cyclopropane fatty-acyl-phospholipid synthase-like methyltransferase
MIADEQPQDLVARGYDHVAEAYTRLEDPGDWPRMQWLDEVLRRLPGSGRVLDLGCGNGMPATAVLAQRHTVTAVDVSARQIELARGNVPQAKLLVADVLDLRFPAGSFDAAVAFYTFDHLPRERLPELFDRIHDWLGDNGLLLFSVETDDQPGAVGQWLGVPMFFSCHDADTTRRLVREAGFELVLDRIERQREGDKDVDYLWVLARKRD